MVGKAPLKKKEATKTKMPTRKPEDIVAELESLKAKKKEIEKREKTLKADLGVILERDGIKTSTGSFNLVIGDKLVQKQARKTMKLNPEKAEQFFKEIGIWEEVTETKQIINEDFVEQAFHNEKFTADELEAITDIKTVYAIVITDYKPEDTEEEMPEIIPNK